MTGETQGNMEGNSGSLRIQSVNIHLLARRSDAEPSNPEHSSDKLGQELPEPSLSDEMLRIAGSASAFRAKVMLTLCILRDIPSRQFLGFLSATSPG